MPLLYPRKILPRDKSPTEILQHKGQTKATSVCGGVDPWRNKDNLVNEIREFEEEKEEQEGGTDSSGFT